MPRRTGPIGATFSPAPAPAPTTPASSDPFNMFDDPSTQLFTQMLGKSINALQQPVQDPTRDAVMALFASKIPSMLNAPTPSVGYGGNALLGDLVNAGRQRITELNQEPFSAGEEAAMRTKAAEQVEQLRTSSRQRALEDTSRLGQGKTSGTLQARLGEVDRSADAARAEGTNQLLLAIAQERQRRKDQAVQVAQSLASAGQAEAGMQLQGQGLQLQASGQRDARTSQALNLAQMLAGMSASARGEDLARQNQALGYAGMLADLPVQRLTLANNILNGSGANNPSSILNGFAQLSNLTQNATNTGNQNQAAMLSGLGQLLGYFASQNRG